MIDGQISCGDKLTTIVRDDLSPGQQLVQTAHAVADFAAEHPAEFSAWRNGSNYLCCLTIEQRTLQRLIHKMEQLYVKHTIFREPDIGNQITAIAVECLPKSIHTKLFKNFKLALNYE